MTAIPRIEFADYDAGIRINVPAKTGCAEVDRRLARVSVLGADLTSGRQERDKADRAYLDAETQDRNALEARITAAEPGDVLKGILEGEVEAEQATFLLARKAAGLEKFVASARVAAIKAARSAEEGVVEYDSTILKAQIRATKAAQTKLRQGVFMVDQAVEALTDSIGIANMIVRGREGRELGGRPKMFVDPPAEVIYLTTARTDFERGLRDVARRLDELKEIERAGVSVAVPADTEEKATEAASTTPAPRPDTEEELRADTEEELRILALLAEGGSDDEDEPTQKPEPAYLDASDDEFDTEI